MERGFDFGNIFIDPQAYLHHTIRSLTTGSKTGYQILTAAPEELGMGPITVYRSLDVLRDQGFVEVSGQLDDEVEATRERPPRKLFRLTDAGAIFAGELGFVDELGVARLIHNREQFPLGE